MKHLDDDIRKLLQDEDAIYELQREEGVFRQMAGLFRGKMRWLAIAVTVESIAFTVLAVLAGIAFFGTEETKWQIFYATSVLLLALLLLLTKLWGWGQMNRNAIRRDLKRLELRILESREPS